MNRLSFPGGIRYAFEEGACVVCSQTTAILVTDAYSKVCEPCSLLLNWAWQRKVGTAPSSPYPTEVQSVLVLVVRERKGDYLVPWDVLMVEQPDFGFFDLPYGPVSPTPSLYKDVVVGEAEAMARLNMMTSLQTWHGAMESLYVGYSPGGKLTKVFLCRAYAGTIKPFTPKQAAVWKPWPPAAHSDHWTGFYEGVRVAFEARAREHRTTSASTAMSLWFDRPAALYMEARFNEIDNGTPPERLKESYLHAMSSEEKESAQMVFDSVAKHRDRHFGPAMVIRPVSAPLCPPIRVTPIDIAAADADVNSPERRTGAPYPEYKEGDEFDAQESHSEEDEPPSHPHADRESSHYPHSPSPGGFLRAPMPKKPTLR